jgi:arginyl-tRNA synthetase
MYETSRITEVDKLVSKIDVIYTAIKGKEEVSNAIVTSKIQDKFEKIRFMLSQKLSEAETFISRRDEFRSIKAIDVLAKAKLQDKIDISLKEINEKLANLNTVLRSQKSKYKKYGTLSFKEEAVKLLEERFKLLRSRN